MIKHKLYYWIAGICFLFVHASVYAVDHNQVQSVPQFKDYPVSTVYEGPPAKYISGDRRVEKSINEALTKEKVEFAGEYIVVGLSCGTAGCVSQLIINKKTGKQVKTGFTQYSVQSDLKGDEDIGSVEERVGEMLEKVKKNSRLLVTREINTDSKPYQYFANFYVLENEDLKLIKKIKIPNPKPIYCSNRGCPDPILTPEK